MEGINILNKEVIEHNPTWWRVTLFIMFVLIIVSMVVLIDDDYSNTINNITWTILFSSGITIFVLIGGDFSKPTDKYEYKVTIEDSVSANDLYDNYKVISKRGKLWTIRDK